MQDTLGERAPCPAVSPAGCAHLGGVGAMGPGLPGRGPCSEEEHASAAVVLLAKHQGALLTERSAR